MGRRDHVLKDGEIGQQPHELKSPDQPEAGYGVRRETGNVPSLKGYGSGSGRDEAGDEVEEGRLAGPIRAYEADYLAFPHAQGKRVDGAETAEKLGQFVRLKHRQASLPSRPPFARRSSRAGRRDRRA